MSLKIESSVVQEKSTKKNLLLILGVSAKVLLPVAVVGAVGYSIAGSAGGIVGSLMGTYISIAYQEGVDYNRNPPKDDDDCFSNPP